VRRAVFLDRDGVILELLPGGESVRTPDEVRLVDGAAQAIARLREAGLLAIVVTNQPGPAKGLYTVESVHGAIGRMHALLAAAGTRVDDVFVCWHHPEGGPGGDVRLIMACECRKPRPGMILEAARKHGVECTRSFLVGDRATDEEAGRAAGCRTILVGPGTGTPRLAEAAEVILEWMAAER